VKEEDLLKWELNTNNFRYEIKDDNGKVLTWVNLTTVIESKKIGFDPLKAAYDKLLRIRRLNQIPEEGNVVSFKDDDKGLGPGIVLNKRYNHLIVGFQTIDSDGDTYLKQFVVFDTDSLLNHYDLEAIVIDDIIYFKQKVNRLP
jgi:hypothetical protein